MTSEETSQFKRQLESVDAEIETFQALIQAKVERGVGRVNHRQVVVAKRPDRLRVEVLTPGVDRTQQLVVSSEGIIQSFNPGQREIVRGEATLSNMYRLFGIPFSPDEGIQWMTGRFLLPDSGVASSSLFITAGATQVFGKYLLFDGRIIYLLWDVIASGPRLAGLQVATEGDGQVLLESRFEYLENVIQGPRMPNRVNLLLPETNVEITMNYQEVQANLDLTVREHQLFNPRFPASLAVIELDVLN